MSDRSQPTDKQLEEGIVYTQKKSLLNRLQNLENSLSEVNTSLPWYRNKNWLLTAIVILLLGGGLLGWFMIKDASASKPGRAIAAYFEPIPHPGMVERNNEQSLEQQAIAAYNQKDYTTAIPLFQALVEEEQDSLSLLYLGIAQLGSGDAEGAIGNIEQYRMYDRSTLADESHFYLTLANVQLGNFDKAKNNAQQINAPQWRGKLEGVFGESDVILNADSVIQYYFNDLSPIRKNSGRTATLSANSKNYFYFPSESKEVENKKYWYHIAELPIPNSFSLVEYYYDTLQNRYVIDSLVDIGPSYNGSISFVANIREKGFERLLFSSDKENGFLEKQVIADIASPVIGWDYKRIKDSVATNSLVACGAKCREVLFLNHTEAPRLLVMYSEENRDTISKRYYYIPCLGKIECNSNGAADVVYYNADTSELFNDWLLPYDSSVTTAPYDLPGVADDLTVYAEELFGNRSDTVRITLTNNSLGFQLKPLCGPKRVVCE